MFSLQNGINAYTNSRKQEINALPGIRAARSGIGKPRPTPAPKKKYMSKYTQTIPIKVEPKNDVETSTKDLEEKAREAKALKYFKKQQAERQEQIKLMSQLMGETLDSDEDE